MRKQERQSGFGTTVVLLAVLVVALLALTGFVVYQHHKPSSTKTSGAASQSQTTAQPQSTTTTQPPAQTAYANWPVYSNKAYGFSYSYPTDWTPSDEASLVPAKNAVRQEFGGGLKLKTDTKYNNTLNFGVLDEPIQTAEASYDQYYAQSSIKVNKTTADLKGKQSVQYDFKAPTYESKLYLFAVGSKTYFFESVNEALNVQNNANYWSDFDNVIASLTIQ